MSSISRKAVVALLGAALGVFLVAGAAAGSPASVATSETYLVLAPQGESTAKAAARVAAAGGTVVADYGQIGVLVARSTNPDFADAASGAGVEAVASTAGLGTPLEEDEISRRRHGRRGGDRRPDRRAALGPAVGHEADRRRRGARGHDRQPEHRRRRPRHGHLEHAPRPRDADRQGQERVLPRRRRGHGRGRLEPDHVRPRYARRRHDRRRAQRRRRRGCRARREGRLGEGRHRRRLHLSRGGGVRLRLGRRARDADHEQQLLHRPVGVQLPQRPASASGLAGRAARDPLLAGTGRAHHRVRGQLQRRPAAQVHRRRQPERRQRSRRDAARSTARASTCPQRRPGVVTVSAVGNAAA